MRLFCVCVCVCVWWCAQLGIERTGYMLRMKRGAMGRKGRWVRRFFVLTTRGLHRFERSRSGQTLFGIEKEVRTKSVHVWISSLL